MFSGALKAFLLIRERVLEEVIVERDRGMERAAVVRNMLIGGRVARRAQIDLKATDRGQQSRAG